KTPITLACGGTGGHIHPAIAVADKLREAGHPLSLILSGTRDAENHTATTWDGPLLKSGARPIRPHPLQLLAKVRAFFRCVRVLKQQRPAVLFATGGYTCFPPVAAARFLKIPVVFHEANSLTGSAIRFCCKHFHIATVATSFQDTAAQLPGTPTVFTGLPLRQHVLDTLAKARAVAKNSDTFSILITGGSQGAHGMNLLIAPVLVSLAKADEKVRILHQCGNHDLAWLQELYADVANRVTPTAFIQDMGTAYGQADLVIARAGAATCFEIARCAVPTIFIPLPTAADNHQRKNAEALVRCGGAICLDQRTTSPEQFAEALRTLYSDAPMRQRMRQAFSEIPQSDAAQAVANLLLHVAHPSA
ncbi:MAG: UDP-N-acetylglucosamine--N-acetylmuramyl-(pentapeptide) pyrophosphoryl-undecaprenol N-acetylglucosamine transferase, partial [Kiritimatiellae bacterium]|nr:UDP-N-acetylglucosamine--N-acetylmuramyl-(pentapeptide) pyrophosphoryl-undecaprenol N-acetylglucosamine transferase [Kiritimatiellia bacterium]